MSMSNNATAAHISTILSKPAEYQDAIYTAQGLDTGTLHLLREHPDSHLWMVGPCTVVRDEDDEATAYDDAVLLVTVLSGGDVRIWAMTPTGEFAAYWEVG